MYVTGSLCCIAEIGTTLQFNYMSIKKKKKEVPFNQFCWICTKLFD